MIGKGSPGLVAGPWTVGDDEYYSDRTCVSHSSLEVFRRNPKEYREQYVFGSERPESAAMAFGKAFHCAILEPEQFHKRYIATPEGIDRRTKVGKEAWAEFLIKAEGKLPISEEDQSRIVAMREAIMANPVAKDILEAHGPREQAYRFRCPITGLWLRSKIDKVAERYGVVDIKTTEDASPWAFSKSVHKYGYHRQAAFYEQAVDALASGGVPRGFTIIAVSSERCPRAAVYELDDEAIELGHRENASDLVNLRDALDYQRWASKWEGGAMSLSLPRYAFTE